ncbi:hypothetical protein [Acinetobacter puyangensis]|uniref:hypothetical protein n=1 Tax=Acinetobacter puyangensis TaxID=1096779 RepID=UPI003A4D9673
MEQVYCRPKHLYVSVRLFPDLKSGLIIGWCTAHDFLQINRIENHGYLDNYVLYDHELRHIDSLANFLSQT